MLNLNLYFGWIWVLLGLISGTALGIFFVNDDWLGGYGSWRRRIVRLGHISFLGTGLLNLAFFFSVQSTGVERPLAAAWLLVLGGLTMPLVCFLSAWKESMRQLFFVPVLSLIVGVGDFLLRGLP